MAAGGIFGGDEVGALVLDPGSRSFRGGFGGEDLPRVDIPSYYAHLIDDSSDLSVKKYLFDDIHLSIPRASYEIKPLFENGSVSDWDAFENICSYAITNRMHVDPKEHPLLITEPYNNSKLSREKMSEILFEKLDVAALNVTKSPALAAFAHGKTSGLVLDVGYSGSVACPVSDGYCLDSFVKSTPVGAAVILNRLRDYISENYSADNIPRQFLKKDCNLFHPTWKRYYEDRLMEDILQNSMYLLTQSDENLHLSVDQEIKYEFPNRKNATFSADFLKIPEVYFNQRDLSTSQFQGHVPLQNLIQNASLACDVDIRANLLNSIIICGGGCNIIGFNERLQNELVKFMSPNTKAKLICGTATERRFAAWTGGSILCSVGSFHQMWVSKQEHLEIGSAAVSSKMVT